MFDTPILFLIFNRPDTTEKVFEKIREIKPKQLFIAADGPREGNERDIINCKAARAIATNVDWPCEVHTLLRKGNLGCGRAVSGAISWFFEHVEEGVILEDDTLPDLNFFWYCESLLKYYRFDTRVMHIGGCNHGFGSEKGSYYFSQHVHIWGWASWRRAWYYYDFNMEKWPLLEAEVDLKALFGSEYEKERRKKNWDCIVEKKIDTWDYQWSFAVLSNGGLSTLPSSNLVQNIGMGADSTHTKTIVSFDTPQQKNLFPLKHPEFFIARKDIDDLYNRKNRFKEIGFVKKSRNRVIKILKNYVKC